ncbi:MAG TPA: M20/M25/M40 family metallo-hydrolase [Longimicrobiales bacterium]|nr:M20/M25/M40 family metallo-hydrolase [Longimicrobiales bacterium]
MRHTAVLCLAALAACGPRAGVETVPGPRAVVIDSVLLIRDISVLSHDSMEGRLVGTPGSARARAYLESRFRQAGLEPVAGQSYLQPFEFMRGNPPAATSGVNIIGVVRGTELPARYIVVTAHYDHVGIREGQIYNGADDNASGTAALMALARTFTQSKPRHSMIFVAFDAEEGGLRGARHFVGDLPVAKDAIVLNVNMDMVSRSDAGELYVAGTARYPHLLPPVQRAIAVAEVKLLTGHDVAGTGRDDWTSQSDHGAFHAAGIPFLYFGVEDHPDYHRPTDDFEKVDPGFYVRSVRTIAAAVRILDRDLP